MSTEENVFTYDKKLRRRYATHLRRTIILPSSISFGLILVFLVFVALQAHLKGLGLLFLALLVIIAMGSLSLFGLWLIKKLVGIYDGYRLQFREQDLLYGAADSSISYVDIDIISEDKRGTLYIRNRSRKQTLTIEPFLSEREPMVQLLREKTGLEILPKKGGKDASHQYLDGLLICVFIVIQNPYIVPVLGLYLLVSLVRSGLQTLNITRKKWLGVLAMTGYVIILAVVEIKMYYSTPPLLRTLGI